MKTYVILVNSLFLSFWILYLKYRKYHCGIHGNNHNQSINCTTILL